MQKNILTCICVRLVVKHDLSLFCDYTTTSLILTCCLTETGVEDRSRHKETFHLADLFFRTRALIFTSLPRTSTFLVISSCKKLIHVNVYYITVPFIKKIRQMNNYVRKIFKIVTCCIHLSSDGHHGFTGDFSTSISGDSGYVGGTANSSAVLSCSADTLTGPVLQTLDLRVIVMELSGLTIMFINITVVPTAIFLSFSWS